MNGVAFSAFPLVLGALVVAASPRRFGVQLGTTLGRWRLVLLLTLAMSIFAAGALTLVGSNPFRGANPIIQVVAVPLSEELVFRGVLFTLVLSALSRVHPSGRALWLAAVISGVAFGIGHLNNLGSYDATFVVAQAVYASVLGVAGGWLRAATSSLLPPFVMHAAVNLVALVYWRPGDRFLVRPRSVDAGGLLTLMAAGSSAWRNASGRSRDRASAAGQHASAHARR